MNLLNFPVDKHLVFLVYGMTGLGLYFFFVLVVLQELLFYRYAIELQCLPFLVDIIL